MRFSTSILLSVVFFAVSAVAVSGSDACLASDCQGLLLQTSNCSFPLQTATTITTEQATCVCYGAGFTDVLDECISCMQPYNIPNFSRSTWNHFCPADAFAADPTATAAAGNTSSVGPAGPENTGTDEGDGPTPTHVENPFKTPKAAAPSMADGRARCVVGGLLLTVGIGFWGVI